MKIEDATMSKCMKVVPVDKEEIEDEETKIKGWYQRLNPRVLLIPSLKTLGNIHSIDSIDLRHLSSREESAPIADAGNCHNLLWSCSYRPS